MIKTSFKVDNYEKERIIKLHENFTKKFYLVEQEKDPNAIDPSNNQGTSVGTDDKYRYFAVQPTKSVTEGISYDKMKNWVSYGIFFIAIPIDQEDVMYKANPKLENEKLSFEVITTESLPKYQEANAREDRNFATELQFKCLVSYDGRNQVLSKPEPANEKTKVASVGAIRSFDQKTGEMMGPELSKSTGEGFLVNNLGRPGIAIVDLENPKFEGANWDYPEDIDVSKVKSGESILLTPNVTGIYYKKIKNGIYGLFSPSVFGGYPVPTGQEPPTPTSPPVPKTITTPKFVFDSGGADVFAFDKSDLNENVTKIVNAFASKVQEYYNTLISQLGEEKGKQEWSKFVTFMKSKSPHKVLGYASIDANPETVITGANSNCQGKRKRSDYNLCLSQARSQTVATALKNKVGGVFGEFVGEGRGETNEFTGNDPKGAWSPNNPNPIGSLLKKNRRFIFTAPQYESQ